MTRDERRAWEAGALGAAPAGSVPVARGLNSSTIRLNVSAFCGTGDAHRGC